MTAPSRPVSAQAPGDAASALRSALRGARRLLHAILGVPDYERYLRHLRAHHPECPVPTQREFERERMTARYERPGSRCC